MTLTLQDGTHEVRIIKDGVEYTKQSHSYIFNSITGVEYTTGIDSLTSIRVTLEPSFDDGLKILQSGLLGVGMSSKGQKPQPANRSEGSASVSSNPIASGVSTPSVSSAARSDLLSSNTGYIVVKFLYPNQRDSNDTVAETPWFTGLLTMPDIDISDGSISITINAMASSGMLAFVQGAATFKNQAALEIIKTLASSMNLTIETANQATAEALSKKISWVANEPKLQSIKSILFKLDCMFRIDSGEGKNAAQRMFITARSTLGDAKVRFTFVQFRQIDPRNDVYPIYSTSLSSTENLFLKGGVFGSFQRCLNESTKQNEQLEVGPKDIDGKSYSGSKNTGGTLPQGEPVYDGGGTGILNTQDSELTGESNLVVVRDDGDNVDEAKSNVKKGVFHGPRYTLTVPGLPRLQTTTLVQVIIGAKISGISGVGVVTKLTHRSGSDGWISEIDYMQTGGLSDSSTVSNFLNTEVKDAKIVSQNVEKFSIPFA